MVREALPAELADSAALMGLDGAAVAHQPTLWEPSILAAISRSTRFWILPPFGPLTIGNASTAADALRHLVGGEALGGKTPAPPVTEIGAGVRDERDGLIALADFAHADHLRAADPGALHQHVLDLGRVYEVAAAAAGCRRCAPDKRSGGRAPCRGRPWITSRPKSSPSRWPRRCAGTRPSRWGRAPAIRRLCR